MRWAVYWEGPEELLAREVFDTSGVGKFDSREEAIAFARSKAKEHGRVVRIEGYVSVLDMPPWKLLLGLRPKEKAFEVSPDGRVKPTQPLSEMLRKIRGT